VDGQVDFKVELAVGRMKLGLGITSCRKVPLALFVCVFSQRSIGVGPSVLLDFLGLLGPFWTAILEVFFGGHFWPFFALFKKCICPILNP
jgi:hypothetical protein